MAETAGRLREALAAYRGAREEHTALVRAYDDRAPIIPAVNRLIAAQSALITAVEAELPGLLDSLMRAEAVVAAGRRLINAEPDYYGDDEMYGECGPNRDAYDAFGAILMRYDKAAGEGE